MGRLTTHVLDTARGVPAAGLRLRLYRHEDAGAVLLLETETNADGRCDAPLLQGDSLTVGAYEIVFEAGAYLDGSGAAVTDPKFLDDIPIRFGVSDVDGHYHVPLLLSAFGYSTYRGS